MVRRVRRPDPAGAVSPLSEDLRSTAAARLPALLVVVLGLVNAVAWLAGATPEMKLNTALALVGLGAALVIQAVL